jgi:hypothetical protein
MLAAQATSSSWRYVGGRADHPQRALGIGQIDYTEAKAVVGQHLPHLRDKPAGVAEFKDMSQILGQEGSEGFQPLGVSSPVGRELKEHRPEMVLQATYPV